MSIAAHALTAHPLPRLAPGAPEQPPRHPHAESRRTSPEQGRALEILGHAIEYLVDSRLYDTGETPGDAQAVHLLMARSREVFSSCDVLVHGRGIVRQSLRRLLRKQTDA